jgi:hypothetical protein
VSDETPKSKIDLSFTQVAAAVLVTVTTTVAGSYLGTSGTLVSAVVMSAISTTAGALYKHGLTVIPARVKNGRLLPAERRWKMPSLSRHQWTALGLAAAGLFAGVLLLQTVVEAAAGKPVAAIVRNEPGHGTTLGGGGTGTPSPAVSPSVQPSGSPVPTGTPTAPSAPAVTPSAPSVPRFSPPPTLPVPTPSFPTQEPLAPSAGPTG